MNDLHAAALAGVFQYLVPEIVLAATACVVFLGGTVKPGRHLWASCALAGLAAALLALALAPTYEGGLQATYGNPAVFDALATLIRGIAIVSGIVLVLFSWNE